MVFASPFPEHIAFVALSEDDLPSGAHIAPEEQKLLRAKASPKRVREFTLGRIAARRALEQLGLEDPPPVLAGSRGEPVWPAHVVGSISHTDGVAAAAAASADKAGGIGLDIQYLKKDIRPEVAERICLPSERAWCGESDDFIERMLAVFSAKETIFKTLYPACRTLFFFHDAELEPLSAGGFRGVLRKNLRDIFPAGFTLEIGAVRAGELLLTHAVLPPAALAFSSHRS